MSDTANEHFDRLVAFDDLTDQQLTFLKEEAETTLEMRSEGMKPLSADEWEAENHMSQLSIGYLSDTRLLQLIEISQQVLDKRYQINPTKLRCPQCQSSGPFRMEIYHWADFDDGSVSVDIDSEPAWGAESACNCPQCEYSGRVIDFING